MSAQSLPDHANESDHRELDIDRVGIRGLQYPITVLDKNNELQHTVADLGLFVGLPQEFKGTHMSRFIEVLNTVRGELTIRNLPSILGQIQRRLEAEDAYLDAEFPYFIEKTAPVSGAKSLMQYQCRFEAAVRGLEQDFVLGVRVPVKSLCPCSKAISEYGAHNQRSWIDVSVRAADFLWIEDVIEAVESCASSPVYALLKREDEKWVTEKAYENPKFAEDLVRDIVLKVRELDGVSWMKVTVENHESIHNHQAYAEIEWNEKAPLRNRAVEWSGTTGASQPFAFGAWIREQREQMKMSQADLASRLDATPSSVSRIESGDRLPSAQMLEQLAEALGQDSEHVQLRAGSIPSDLMGRIQANPEGFRRLLTQLGD